MRKNDKKDDESTMICPSFVWTFEITGHHLNPRALQATCSLEINRARLFSPFRLKLNWCFVGGMDGVKRDTTHTGRRRGRVVERGLDSVRWFREEDRRKLGLRRGNRWANPLVFQPRHVLSWLYSFAFRFVVGEDKSYLEYLRWPNLIGFAYTRANWRKGNLDFLAGLIGLVAIIRSFCSVWRVTRNEPLMFCIVGL